MRIRRAAAVVAAFALTGCCHAVIQTGRPESSDVISIKWANSFIYGLVPPPVVETASRARTAWRRSRRSTASSTCSPVVTFGHLHPMQIDVTCAARGTASAAPRDQGRAGPHRRAGAERGRAHGGREGHPVYVQF